MICEFMDKFVMNLGVEGLLYLSICFFVYVIVCILQDMRRNHLKKIEDYKNRNKRYYD